jgi:hypothetical protein
MKKGISYYLFSFSLPRTLVRKFWKDLNDNGNGGSAMRRKLTSPTTGIGFS